MSNKVRVYELAKESGLHNKEVLRRLHDLGIEASGPAIDDECDDASIPRSCRRRRTSLLWRPDSLASS